MFRYDVPDGAETPAWADSSDNVLFDVPKCVPKTCDVDFEIFDGVVDCSDELNFKSKLQVQMLRFKLRLRIDMQHVTCCTTCRDKFELQGNRLVTCSESGLFEGVEDKHEAYCHEIKCPSLANPETGVITLGRESE